MALDKIMTIHEVRKNIDYIYDILETCNSHAVDNFLDGYDYNNLRKAWETCRKLKCARWTNQIL